MESKHLTQVRLQVPGNYKTRMAIKLGKYCILHAVPGRVNVRSMSLKLHDHLIITFSYFSFFFSVDTRKYTLHRYSPWPHVKLQLYVRFFSSASASASSSASASDMTLRW